MVADTRLYRDLQVEPDASDAEIRKAYKKLVLKLHPDKCSAGDTGDEFRKVQTAYEILSDEEKRKRYDLTGRILDDVEQNHGGPDLANIFGNIFGFQNQNQQARQQVDSATVFVTLADVYSGGVKHVAFDLPDMCDLCKGHGVSDPVGDFITCIQCGGRGACAIQVGPFVMASSECPSCAGFGSMIKPGCACPGCNGKKVVSVRRSFDVRLPRGIPDGHTHTIQGKGSFDPKSRRQSDVRLTFQYAHQDDVTFEGDEVAFRMKVSLEEVLCGFSRTERPWNVPISFRARGYFDPKKEYRFPSRGLPVYRKSDKFMNLIVRFDVSYPDQSAFAAGLLTLVKKLSLKIEKEEDGDDDDEDEDLNF